MSGSVRCSVGLAWPGLGRMNGGAQVQQEVKRKAEAANQRAEEEAKIDEGRG